ncbi:hypothetical protein [Microbacterium thalassium]|uniref:Uncharacterized protein n=1 Tax=Microbacterium thalassium TaxID=362649 RepID=A0A7X0KTK1_9MICO|nr:hypothetical protein [Microbacterium thalassium]MBB6390138.1 hypothetical protein [Microbacterium thalassium]GLK25246.1 hypothetical protein GCM10017607_25650 [Microbacterium thalassium]
MTTDPDAEPMPPFAARYLTHLWRGGYLWGVAGFAALQLIFGREPAAVLYGALVTLALLAVVAAFNLRRLERLATFRPRDVGVGETIDDHLPVSAVTAPDALQSARDAGVLWTATLVLATAGLSWGWVAILGFEPAGPAEFAAFVAVIVGSVAYLILAPSIVIALIIRARNAGILAHRPGALVLTGWFGLEDVITTGNLLRRLTSTPQPWWRARVRSFETVVADGEGIAFWRGGAHPIRQYLLPWDQVGPVAMTIVGVGSSPSPSGIAVNARLPEEDQGWAHVEFIPTRTSMLLAFPYTSPDKVSAFARAIEARRPYRTGFFRGASLEEWRTDIEGSLREGDLDEPALEDLLDELRLRREQQTAATAWVPAMLADSREDAGRIDEARALRAEADAWSRR